MKRYQKIGYLLVSHLLLWGLGVKIPVNAQISSDNTLRIQTIVEQSGNDQLISGGTEAGRNLFHSFRRFSISNGATAYFNNSQAIDRIFARVTGRRSSEINGAIRANGSADLFLLNPRGIIFGPNAQLDIGGSFVASTAEHLLFEDGSVFSATAPQAMPLLTVSTPIGLRFGERSEGIINQANRTMIDPNGVVAALPGLQVAPGETLAFVGGDIVFDGGIALAPQGQVLLGSVQSPNTVRIQGNCTGYSLTYTGVESFGDIRLTNLASINTSGQSGGAVQVYGANLVLAEGAKISSSTLSDSSGLTQPGQNIMIHTTESVQVLGTTSIPGLFDPSLVGIQGAVFSAIVTDTLGAGDAGDIIITTSRVVISDGARISANTLGFEQSGNGGNIVIDASDSFDIRGTVDVSGTDDIFPFPAPLPEEFSVKVNGAALLLTVSVNQGSAGNITINTDRLTLQDGGAISSTARGLGDGGDLVIHADTIDVEGTDENRLVNSGIVSSTAPISLDSLELDGKSGNITLNARRLRLRDGGVVSTQTFGSGEGGTITINASEFVEVSNSFLPAYSGLRVDTFNSGEAGALRINAGQLVLEDQGLVEVSSFGSGAAGNLNVVVDTLRMENASSINGTTASGRGGNLSIHAENLLLLRNRSQISAQAGGTGNGGNLTIDTPAIVAVLDENSDILANAMRGNGGNIDITANSIFGSVTTNGPLDDTISEINASSETGIDGVIDITTPDVDPSRGTTELPTELVDRAHLVGRSLCAAGLGSEFTAIGRGGLPTSPHAPLISEGIWDDWYITDQAHDDVLPNGALPIQEQDNVQGIHDSEHMFDIQGIASAPEPFGQDPSPIAEAQGWFLNRRGQVVLAMMPTVSTPHGEGIQPVDCRRLRHHLYQESSQNP